MCLKIGHVLKLVDENGTTEVDRRGRGFVNGHLLGQPPGPVDIVVLGERAIFVWIKREKMLLIWIG